MDEHTLRVLEFDKVRTMLLRFCGSSLGRGEVERLGPDKDPDQIKMCLEETTQMRRLLTETERLPFAGLRDITGPLEQIHRQGRPPEPEVFRDIYGVLVVARDFIRLFGALAAETYPRLRTLGEQLYDLHGLYDLIDLYIDARNVIRTESSERLSSIRRAIEQCEVRIRQRVERYLQNKTVRKALMEPRFALRDGRCVLPVRLEHKGSVQGILHDTSHSGSTVYIEPTELVQLGNELSERMAEEEKEETRLLWELTLQVRDEETQIHHNLEILARIELTWAKACMADTYDMVAPQMTDDRALSITQGCHPLLLDMDGPAVPLSLRVGEDFDTLVVTGPNTGGKTVAVKTTGLIALMAHCGMHVPAATPTVIPYLSGIWADIGDEQSIEQSLSTFSAHVSRIIAILKHADAKSLVLMDEFGSGTDPAEGAALAEAILDKLAERSAAVIVTTHIGDLKSYAYSRARAENASMEFDVASLKPTYRLSIGQPGASNAITIAARLGIDSEVTGVARTLLERDVSEATDLIHQMQESRSAIENDREATAKARKEITKLKKEQERLVREVRTKEKMLSDEAERMIDEIFNSAIDSIAAPLNQLKAGPAAVADQAQRLETKLREQFDHTPLARRRQELISGLHKNDYVYVPRFGKALRVTRVDKKRRRLHLTADNLPVEVDFDDVSAVPPGQ